MTNVMELLKLLAMLLMVLLEMLLLEMVLEVVIAVTDTDDDVAGPTGEGATLTVVVGAMTAGGYEVVNEAGNVSSALERTETALVVAIELGYEVIVWVVVVATTAGTTTGMLVTEALSLAPAREC